MVFVNELGRLRLLTLHLLEEDRKHAQKWWGLRALQEIYIGHSFIRIRRNGKPFRPFFNSKNKNFFIDLGNNGIVTVSRLTRILSGHAPTGEYRERFFPDKDTHCHHCGYGTFHSRLHILTECTKYSFLLRSLNDLIYNKDNGKAIRTYLKVNPTAFTFNDLPPEPP